MKFIQLPYCRETATRNMAIDACMLEHELWKNDIVMRIYGWTHSAITFGYSQSFQEVTARFPEDSFTRIRRMTGGGIVDHSNDLTYCLKIPPQHKTFRLDSTEFYKYLHQQIAQALAHHYFPTQLQPCQRQHCSTLSAKLAPRVSTECFEQAEPFDLVDPQNQKIAGAALKRNRQGLLIQGSIQIPTTAESLPKVCKSIIDTFHHWLNPNGQPTEENLPTCELCKRVELKFASVAWNQKR